MFKKKRVPITKLGKARQKKKYERQKTKYGQEVSYAEIDYAISKPMHILKGLEENIFLEGQSAPRVGRRALTKEIRDLPRSKIMDPTREEAAKLARIAVNHGIDKKELNEFVAKFTGLGEKARAENIIHPYRVTGSRYDREPVVEYERESSKNLANEALDKWRGIASKEYDRVEYDNYAKKLDEMSKTKKFIEWTEREHINIDDWVKHGKSKKKRELRL